MRNKNLSKRSDASGIKGISPFIASVLTILFGVIMLTLVLAVVNPTLKRVQDSSVISDANQNLNLLNSVIKEVASESQGSKRSVSISVSDGEYSIDSTTDLLIFKYDPSEDMQLEGTKGDIEVEHGSVFLDFFNWYVEDGKADPVWKNISGRWNVDNYKYKGDGGLAYHNLSTIANYKFSGKIYNSSGGTGGQIFMLPTNPERLVAFWPFDNRSGSKAYDWSGNKNNGTLTNMNTTTGNSTSGWQSSSSCKAGLSCLLFDGVNDYVSVSDSVSLNISTRLTATAWIKKQDTDFNVVMDKYDTQSNQRGWQIWFSDRSTGSGDYITFSISPDGTATTSLYGSQITDTNWHHIAAVYTGSKMQMYIDGVLDNETNYSNDIHLNSEPFMIGAVQITNSPSRYFNGTIDEVKIWNVSLTADEVAAEYELSAKKLIASGSQTVGAKTPNAAIVLSNPDGITSFDDIKVSTSSKEQKLVIPYSKIDLNGTFRIVKGEHKLSVEHMGTNTTLSKPIVQITAS